MDQPEPEFQTQNVKNTEITIPQQTLQTQKEQSHQQNKQEPQSSTQINDRKSWVSEEQIPDHFYDSDIASVCQKDFMSDNQPPKDIVQERKLLYKEKLLHVFKTIIRVGTGIDKPARYDRIRIKHRQVPKQDVIKYMKQKKLKKNQNKQQQITSDKNKESHQQKQQDDKKQQNQIKQKQQNEQQQHPTQLFEQLPPFYSTQYVDGCPDIDYNIGNQYEQIQRLITSMKRGQTALFQLQHLAVSKKSNIKLKARTQIHVVHAFDWTTVIDLEGDKKYLKYMLRKGQGAFRVALYDKICCTYEIKRNGLSVQRKQLLQQRLQKQYIQNELPNIVWRVLTSMKDKQSVRLQIIDEDLKQIQSEQYYCELQKIYNNKKQQQYNNKKQQQYNNENKQQQHKQLVNQQIIWILTLQIQHLLKVDDIHLDGRILKQTIIRGISTAKPQSQSLVYYALKFINNQQQVLKVDQCFDSDWWEDFGKLDQLKGIRKNHLDDYSLSKMLKKAIKRMKPAETALVQCRDKQLFTYGNDYNQLKELIKFNQTPSIVKIIIRIYNFTEARTAFSMDIDQKIIQSRRKKQIAVKLLSQNKIQKALKRFQSIIAFYSSEKINQQAYDQKVSALMNAILCYMKLKKYTEMINLCNQILLKPRHGHLTKDMKIIGPGHAKIQGSLEKPDHDQSQQPQAGNGDSRRIATELSQNQKILDKCLYRKAFALVQMGQCAQALKSIDQISQAMSSTEQVEKLKAQALKGKTKYEQKSKKIFKSMFG